MAKLSPHILHRWMGVGVAIIVILLTITGILLNHTSALKLDQRHVNYPWLLNWYGIKAPQSTRSFKTSTHWITQMGSQLFFDEQRLQTLSGKVMGAIELDDMLVIALPQQLLLFSLDAELIEQMTVDFEIEQLGITSQQQIVALSLNQYHYSDDGLLSWEVTQTMANVRWSKLQAPPNQLADNLRRYYIGEGLPVERIILDIHSGRFMGKWGVWLVDIAAILFCLLAISGLWMWATRALYRQKIKKKVAYGKKKT